MEGMISKYNIFKSKQVSTNPLKLVTDPDIPQFDNGNCSCEGKAIAFSPMITH